MLSGLQHPNIVRYHECFQEGGRQYIAMEYCEVLRCGACKGDSSGC